ncbi:hypothetical protein BJY04DRAFT_215378 [Aspergillus karnatakaensis]|uniref:uncharacterized protein n=1 Tax=Aspergillus karnatakaensis TaxID=1810916 RepID=UPI003CCDB222
MSPVKETASTPFGKESTPTPTIVRRSKTMPTDSPTAKFLYTIIKQLDLKGARIPPQALSIFITDSRQIDWTLVASQLEISNGHAARMRYHRFRNQMEGINPTQRKRQSKPVKTGTSSCKTGLKKQVSPPPSQPVKIEPSSASPYLSSPYIKPEPYIQQMPHLADIPPFTPQMTSVLYPHSAPYQHSMPAPYPQMTLSPHLRMYSSTPEYPPVPMGFEQICQTPVDWTPVKAEQQSFSDEHREVSAVEPVLKEEVDADASVVHDT